MNSPTLDVVLPTFNNELTIRAAVEAVLDQTFRDFRLIIVNDASTDRTREIASSISDPRISIINNKENLGCGGSKNVGLAATTAPFVAFVDGDDTINPRRFEIQIEYLQNHESCSVLGSQITSLQSGIKSNLPLHNWEIRSYLYYRNCLAMPTIMIRRASFPDHMFKSLFNPQNRFCEDYELWLKLLKDKSLKFHNLDISTVLYDSAISEETSRQRTLLAQRLRQDFLADRSFRKAPTNPLPIRLRAGYFFARLTTAARGLFG